MTEEIIKNIAIINGRIKDACRSNRRNPDEVKLLLATKTVLAERIKIALQVGQTMIAELQITGVEMNELSMGMSGDLETAIEEGATIVRIGTAIFGQRIHPDSYYWNENV